MSLQEMISRHPQVTDATLNEALVEASRHANLCAQFCSSCAEACVVEDMDMAQCIRNCLDCADVCTATARLGIRRTAQNVEVLRAQIQACIAACEACAAECVRHDNPHCSKCAEMCREVARDFKACLDSVD